eukprot:7487008-Heterocapsa_arctica.AAC.1
MGQYSWNVWSGKRLLLVGERGRGGWKGHPLRPGKDVRLVDPPLRGRLAEHGLRAVLPPISSAAPSSLGSPGGARGLGKAARRNHNGVGRLLARLVALPGRHF